MQYERQTTGKVSDVVGRLERAATEHGFGVLGTIDLRAKMVEKGVPFDRDCVIVEVCNPHQAKAVLDQNPAISTALPCRISAYEHDGIVTVATLKPTLLLQMYDESASLAAVATDVENTLIEIIDAACPK